jgi:hypothetical protein
MQRTAGALDDAGRVHRAAANEQFLAAIAVQVRSRESRPATVEAQRQQGLGGQSVHVHLPDAQVKAEFA